MRRAGASSDTLADVRCHAPGHPRAAKLRPGRGRRLRHGRCSDHAGRLESGLPQLAALLDHVAARKTLRSMGDAALRAAIEAPARRVGLVWEGDLAARVLADAGGTASGLPLVAHVLRALFERREGRKLTLAAYEGLGGVAGALTKSADAALAPLGSADKERARKMLLRLVKIGRGTSDSRQPAPHAEVLDAAGGGKEAAAVLDRLAGSRDRAAGGPAPARLVVVGSEDSADRVDLVHEALLRQWQTLAAWIDARRKALEQRDDLEHQAQVWVAAGRSDSGLATGDQLAYLRGAEAPNERARVFLEKVGAARPAKAPVAASGACGGDGDGGRHGGAGLVGECAAERSEPASR